MPKAAEGMFCPARKRGISIVVFFLSGFSPEILHSYFFHTRFACGLAFSDPVFVAHQKGIG